MDNDNNSQPNEINPEQRILLYPLNGRSSYLIDKFYIFGYDYQTLQKYLYNDENIKNILNEINKKHNRISFNDEDFQIFYLNDPPVLLNEFTSDYEKECLDVDMIREMIIPKNLNFYFLEEEKENEKKTRKRLYNNTVDKNNKDAENENSNFCVFDEGNKEITPQSYNVIFSSNPQSGNNSKKSINGFAYVFYRKLKEQKNYSNKYYSFYIPIIFCVISEFPFYNSFYCLCQQIAYLFSSYEVRIPLEILLHNIVNITPSPLNSDVYISLKSIINMDIIVDMHLKRQISDIQEEEYIDYNHSDLYN